MSQLPDTSHAANREMTKELREEHHAKIISALEAIGAAIYEDIALKVGLDRHQVGRRLKELVEAGKIYNTLQTGLTSKGRKANKYALRFHDTIIPQPETHYMEGQTTAADFACTMITHSENAKKYKESLLDKPLVQKDLFDAGSL